jgi:hypothetical protein
MEDTSGISFDKADLPPHPKELESLVRSLVHTGLVPIRFSVTPPSVACQGLWRYSEIADLLSEYSKTHKIGWCIDEDGLTIKPYNPCEFSNEELVEDSDALAQYLFEATRERQVQYTEA